MSLKNDLCRGFPPELRLLLECAQQQPDARQAAKIREASAQDIDWTAFVGLAERHRAVPHAFLALSRSASDLVPPASLDELGRHFDANARKNLVRAGELARISAAANEAGIPLLCFKGPALAMQLYDGLQCRQFRDLDLLVPREHIFRAAGLLNELGYREQHVAPLTSFGPRQRKRLIKFNRHVAMCNPSIPGVMVELHWEIGKFGQVSIATERLFSDAHQRVLGKGRFHVLPPQEQAVFLAWHGSVHRWKRLSWLFDFSEAMRSTPEFEETRLLQSARALGVEKHTALALALARTLTGCDVPATVGSLPNVRREMECSCRAIAADETYYENKPLAWLFWSWQMSSSQWLLPRLLIHTFVPSMEHIHLSGPLAYLKRLQRVSSRTCQLLVSKFASIRCQAGVRR